MTNISMYSHSSLVLIPLSLVDDFNLGVVSKEDVLAHFA